jgi:hypothetical protein
MKTFAGFAFLLSVCLLAGCFFNGIHESDLVGKYEVSLPDGGIESLELLEEGKCKQVIRLSNGMVYEAKGNWELSPHHGGPHLIFKGIRSPVKGFNEINPDIAKPPIGAIGKIVIAGWTGKPIIKLTEDTYYRKIR